MTLRQAILTVNVLLTLVFNIVDARAQVSQRELARQLIEGDGVERTRAFGMARAIGAQKIAPELRAALFTALEREGRLNAQWRRGEIGFLDDPELIAGLANLVAEFRDVRSIPALAGALGTSPPAARALASFGEPAVQSVLSVVTSTDDGSVVMDALISLRLMAEGVLTSPLTAESLHDIRRVAQQRLTGRQAATSLWRAIDLAVALQDPDLRRVVESFATDRSAVAAIGISDPELIRYTQKLATDRLAGILPLPRR